MSKPAFSAESDSEVEPSKPAQSGGRLLVLAILLLALAGYFVWDRMHQPVVFRGDHPSIGTVWNGVNVTTIADSKISLNSNQLAGKVALVNLWGPWCGPCVAEFPELDDLRAEFAKETDFRMVLLSMPAGNQPFEEHVQDTRDFLRQNRYEPSNVYFDESRQTVFSLLKTAKIKPKEFGFPTTVLLDRKGAILALWEGYMPGATGEMKTMIARELKKKS